MERPQNVETRNKKKKKIDTGNIGKKISDNKLYTVN